MGDNDINEKVSFSQTTSKRLKSKRNSTCDGTNAAKRLKRDDVDPYGDTYESTIKNDETTNRRVDYSDGIFKRKNPIMYMPTEMLQKIFSYMSYKDLGLIYKVRNIITTH